MPSAEQSSESESDQQDNSESYSQSEGQAKTRGARKPPKSKAKAVKAKKPARQRAISPPQVEYAVQEPLSDHEIQQNKRSMKREEAPLEDTESEDAYNGHNFTQQPAVCSIESDSFNHSEESHE